MAMMKRAGIVIYLQAGIYHLLRNLQRSTDARPLLLDQPDIPAYLADLLYNRRIFYEQAHFTVQAEEVSFSTFAQIISSCISRH
jgi:shikimate kinase